MRLDFECLFEGVSDHLDTTRFVLFLGATADTAEDCATVVHQDDLLQAVLLLELSDFVFVRFALL